MAAELVEGPDGAMRFPQEAPAAAFRTFRIVAPLATHFVPATCAEVDCPQYLDGWKTIVPADSPQAAYIRSGSGRGFTEVAQPGGLAEFSFPPGQRCFASADHKRRLEREEIFVFCGGDWRGNPLGTPPQRIGVTSWVDEFGEHQERIAQVFERG
jgi:hypothetical protein